MHRSRAEYKLCEDLQELIKNNNEYEPKIRTGLFKI